MICACPDCTAEYNCPGERPRERALDNVPGCVGRHHGQYCQGFRDAAAAISDGAMKER